jgi:hypothetical protein
MNSECKLITESRKGKILLLIIYCYWLNYIAIIYFLNLVLNIYYEFFLMHKNSLNIDIFTRSIRNT